MIIVRLEKVEALEVVRLSCAFRLFAHPRLMQPSSFEAKIKIVVDNVHLSLRGARQRMRNVCWLARWVLSCKQLIVQAHAS